MSATVVDTAERERTLFLRRLEELLQAILNGGLPAPDYLDHKFTTVHFYAHGTDEVRALVRQFASLGVGTFAKQHDGISPGLTAELPSGLKVQIELLRDVCERVQVGTERRTVEKVITPAVVEKVDEEVPVYETRCPDSLLRPDVVEQSKAEIRDVLGMDRS